MEKNFLEQFREVKTKYDKMMFVLREVVVKNQIREKCSAVCEMENFSYRISKLKFLPDGLDISVLVDIDGSNSWLPYELHLTEEDLAKY